MLQQLLFVSVLSIIFARGALNARMNRVTSCLVSLISGIIYLTCMWIPVHLQSMGVIVGKLEVIGIVSLPKPDEISTLSLRWALELTVILVAEVGCVQLLRPTRYDRFFASLGSDSAETRQITTLLILIGVVATIALPAISPNDRAQGGHGAYNILGYFSIMGLAMLAYNKVFRRWLFVVIGVAGIAFVASSNIRSPLLVVLTALLAGTISRSELNLRRAVAFALLTFSFALAGALMSSLRGAILRREVVSKSALVTSILQRPLQSIYGAGIDTLDGYRFCMLVQPEEQPRPLSIVTIVTTFIPRELWPNKPTDPSVEISAKYFHYGTSGQFLSPVGYLSIVFGGYLGALGGMFVFSVLASWLGMYFRQSFILTIIICVVIRFLLGGAFFDIYYGLALLIPLLVCRFVIRFLGRREVSPWTRHAEAEGAGNGNDIVAELR